jgi:hypothetical protein
MDLLHACWAPATAPFFCSSGAILGKNASRDIVRSLCHHSCGPCGAARLMVRIFVKWNESPPPASGGCPPAAVTRRSLPMPRLSYPVMSQEPFYAPDRARGGDRSDQPQREKNGNQQQHCRHRNLQGPDSHLLNHPATDEYAEEGCHGCDSDQGEVHADLR